jgi:transcriptional regulator with XRE-family HTH domain
MFLSTNIKFLRNRQKKNQEDTAIDLDMTRVKYNSYENGYRNNLPAEDLIRVSEYFGFSIDVLLKTDLTKLKESQFLELSKGTDAYAKGNKIRILATTVDKKNRENIEYVPVKVRAGYLTGYHDPEFIASLQKVVLPFVDDRGKTMRFFDCSGDSMLPLDNNCQVLGEFIQDWPAIKDGTKCIVISHTKGYAIKEVYNQIKSKKTIRLHEINEIWVFKGYFSKKFPEQTIDDNDKKNLTDSVKKIMITLKKINSEAFAG